MGSNTSKTNAETAVFTVKNNLDEIGNLDPRSPTPEIIRTPLQNKIGGKHNITKNVDLRKTFEATKEDEKLIHNPILSAVIKSHLQSYDPRSPTQDFERTPIIITSKIEELSEINLLQSQIKCASPVLQNDDNNTSAEAYKITPQLTVPKNLCDKFYDISLNETLKEDEEPLGSSTASNEAIEENSTHASDNKPTKLLETNFDYKENNSEIFEDSQENNEEENNKTDNDLYCVPIFKILDDDPRSPSIGIERTPIVVAKDNENASQGNVEDMSDDTLIKVLQNTNSELRQCAAIPTDKNSDGLLVYEDETANVCDTPKKTKSANNSGSRTPLSCMKNKADAGHARSKSANMLYNPKDQKNGPSRIPKRVSHIPRLKSLCKPSKLTPTMSSISLKNISKTSIMGGDCENTPPHSHRDIWDKDNSIVL